MFTQKSQTYQSQSNQTISHWFGIVSRKIYITMVNQKFVCRAVKIKNRKTRGYFIILFYAMGLIHYNSILIVILPKFNIYFKFARSDKNFTLLIE